MGEKPPLAPCRKRPTTTHTIEPAAAATTRPSTNVPMHTMNGSAGPRRSSTSPADTIATMFASV